MKGEVVAKELTFLQLHLIVLKGFFLHLKTKIQQCCF